MYLQNSQIPFGYHIAYNLYSSLSLIKLLASNLDQFFQIEYFLSSQSNVHLF